MRYLVIFKCPECETLDTEVDYNVSTNSSEYGKATLHTNDDGEISPYIDYNSSDYGDTDWNDDLEFECTECEHCMTGAEFRANCKAYTISEEEHAAYLRSNINLGDIVKRRRKKIQHDQTIVDEKPDFGSKVMIMKKDLSTSMSELGFGIECPECHAIFAKEEKEERFECIECGTEFEIKNLIDKLCLQQ